MRRMELIIFLRFLFNCTRTRSRETYDNGGTGEGACYWFEVTFFSTCTTGAFVYRMVMSLTDSVSKKKKKKKITAFDEESSD